MDASKCMRLRLVVEDMEQRRRIVSITHEDSHFGVNRTYATIASKYYWPGLFLNVKQKRNFTFVGIIDILYMIVPPPIVQCM